MTTGQSFSDYVKGDFDWTDEEPEYELCPNCEGDGSVAHRCSCGTMPINTAYGYCESCHKPVVWKTCRVCGGKGTLITK